MPPIYCGTPWAMYEEVILYHPAKQLVKVPFQIITNVLCTPLRRRARWLALKGLSSEISAARSDINQ